MFGQVKWFVAAVLAGLLAAPVLGQPLRLDVVDRLQQGIDTPLLLASNLKERVEAIRKVPSLRKEAVQKATAKLSDEQKKTWNEMTGEKFELPLDMLRSSILP